MNMVYAYTFGASANGSSTGTEMVPGIHLAIMTGTFDSATVDLEYSRDGGATWDNVWVAGLVGITAAMSAPLEIRAAKGALFRWTATGGGGSMDVDCWMAYGG